MFIYLLLQLRTRPGYLRKIVNKRSNDVARQVETPNKRTTFVLHQWLRDTMTAKQVNTAIDGFLV